MGGFLSSILGGQNENLNADINQTSQIAGFGQSLGEGDIGAASGFYNTLLGGNQAQEAQLLAPEISNIQKQGQQQIQTEGEFGNRSGGTNASAQNNIDTQRAQVSNMISQLTGGAASGLANIGQNALNTGLNANQLNEQESQQRMQNWQNSILGKGITGAAEAGESLAGGELGTFASTLGSGNFGW